MSYSVLLLLCCGVGCHCAHVNIFIFYLFVQHLCSAQNWFPFLSRRRDGCVSQSVFLSLHQSTNFDDWCFVCFERVKPNLFGLDKCTQVAIVYVHAQPSQVVNPFDPEECCTPTKYDGSAIIMVEFHLHKNAVDDVHWGNNCNQAANRFFRPGPLDKLVVWRTVHIYPYDDCETKPLENSTLQSFKPEVDTGNGFPCGEIEFNPWKCIRFPLSVNWQTIYVNHCQQSPPIWSDWWAHNIFNSATTTKNDIAHIFMYLLPIYSYTYCEFMICHKLQVSLFFFGGGGIYLLSHQWIWTCMSDLSNF